MSKRTAEELPTPPAKRVPTYETLERRIKELEEDNANMRYSFAAIEAKADEFENKYCNLVHLGRDDGDETFHARMKQKHSAEYAMLTGEASDSDFQHGFNSGALATSRLLRCLAEHFPEQHRRHEELLDEHDAQEEEAMTGPMLLQREYDYHINEFPLVDS